MRRPEHLDDLSGIVIPGGETTTMSKLARASGLFEPLSDRLSNGMVAFGTCAGAIMLSAEILGGRDDQGCFGAIDCVVRRNGYGTQLDSFETDVAVEGIGPEAFHAVFIRAPIFETTGPSVTTIGEVDGEIVAVENDSVIAVTFHPELTHDRRLHRRFLDRVEAR